MKQKKVILIPLAIILGMLLCFTWGFYSGYNTHLDKSRSDAARLVQTENTLTQWVYNHSAKISKDTAKAIAREAVKSDRPLLILAIASVESEMVPSATSGAGAKGLMQIMWKVWGSDLIKAGIAREERDLYNIDTSTRAGNLVIGKLLKQSNGDVKGALEKYLGGRDGYYVNRIQAALSNLYVLTGGK
jgi:soluble lytic murein transglycosylase-like protein